MFKKCSSPLIFRPEVKSIIDFLSSSFFLFPPSSASGTSAVAIDNKIEQAMVSKILSYFSNSWLHFLASMPTTVFLRRRIYFRASQFLVRFQREHLKITFNNFKNVSRWNCSFLTDASRENEESQYVSRWRIIVTDICWGDLQSLHTNCRCCNKNNCYAIELLTCFYKMFYNSSYLEKLKNTFWATCLSLDWYLNVCLKNLITIVPI